MLAPGSGRFERTKRPGDEKRKFKIIVLSILLITESDKTVLTVIMHFETNNFLVCFLMEEKHSNHKYFKLSK